MTCRYTEMMERAADDTAFSRDFLYRAKSVSNSFVIICEDNVPHYLLEREMTKMILGIRQTLGKLPSSSHFSKMLQYVDELPHYNNHVLLSTIHLTEQKNLQKGPIHRSQL